MNKKDRNAGLKVWMPSQMGLNQYEIISYTYMLIRGRTPYEA